MRSIVCYTFLICSFTLSKLKAQQNLVFKDSFHSNSNGWIIGQFGNYSLQINNGKYWIDQKHENKTQIAWRKDITLQSSNPFSIEALVAPAKNSSGSAGIMWGGMRKAHLQFLSFVINYQGEYAVIQHQAGEELLLLEGKKSNDYKVGFSTQLKVEHRGDHIYRFYINGKIQDSLEIEEFYGNWLGFAAKGKIKSSFDAFAVYQNGTAPVVSEVVTYNNEQASQQKNHFVRLDSDVDFSPATFTLKPNAIAIVIGNRNYDKTKNVDYAINDAKSMKNFLITTMGYQEANIFYLPNASLSDFTTFFGTKDNFAGKLFNSLKKGISEVFIYYAGHGAPGLKDQKGYFVPVECDPQYVENSGYSLDVFFQNIAKLPASKVTVMLDACFSGDKIYTKISPIVIRANIPTVNESNILVLSSSSSNQVSTWYPEKKHGLFTYMVLKAAIDKENSDRDKNNILTYQELYAYISDESIGVPYLSRKLHGIEQNPTIQGNSNDSFVVYKPQKK